MGIVCQMVSRPGYDNDIARATPTFELGLLSSMYSPTIPRLALLGLAATEVSGQ